MTVDQISAFAILAGVLVFFIGGWLRYDFVAFGALFAAVVSGNCSGWLSLHRVW